MKVQHRIKNLHHIQYPILKKVSIFAYIFTNGNNKESQPCAFGRETNMKTE